jgi:hypothetical protein
MDGVIDGVMNEVEGGPGDGICFPQIFPMIFSIFLFLFLSRNPRSKQIMRRVDRIEIPGHLC